jgi:serine-type D-Ala-D-Ala carboxypeptidase (penicillin-binding protein 5/6)
MALPVVTPGRRRRRRRWPYVLIITLVLAVALVAGPWQGWTSFVTSEQSPSGSERRSGAPRPRLGTPRTSASSALVVAGHDRAPHRFRPPLTARAAILVDASTGSVVWAARPHRRLPIASLTKIMTALVARETVRNADIITVRPGVRRVEPIREGLRVGERVRAWKLFYGLLLFSGNDDARALAFASAGSERAFVERMNLKAGELGLRDTHFSNSSGAVDRGNYSTVWDLVALTRVAMRDSFLRAVVRTKRKRVRWAPPTFSKIYVNKNRLLVSYRGAKGVKTGWTTKAAHCLVASAHRRGVRLIAVVLGSRDAFSDATRLLDYGFASR